MRRGGHSRASCGPIELGRHVLPPALSGRGPTLVLLGAHRPHFKQPRRKAHDDQPGNDQFAL